MVEFHQRSFYPLVVIANRVKVAPWRWAGAHPGGTIGPTQRGVTRSIWTRQHLGGLVQLGGPAWGRLAYGVVRASWVTPSVGVHPEPTSLVPVNPSAFWEVDEAITAGVVHSFDSITQKATARFTEFRSIRSPDQRPGRVPGAVPTLIRGELPWTNWGSPRLITVLATQLPKVESSIAATRLDHLDGYRFARGTDDHQSRLV